MKKPVHILTVLVVVFVFSWLQIERAKAEGLFDGPGLFDTPTKAPQSVSIWKSDGSLVIINGADEAGYVIKGGDDGSEIEYYVKPKDDGSPTFIYDDELLICSNTGCY